MSALRGTSKGGLVVAIQKELGQPIKYIGLGEQPDDLATLRRQTIRAGVV